VNRNRARIEGVWATVEATRLKVRLRVCEDGGKRHTAFLPDRELSALLPRSILLVSLQNVPRELLDTIDPMLDRLLKGRMVRLWRYSERWYASFLPWRSVRFAES